MIKVFVYDREELAHFVNDEARKVVDSLSDEEVNNFIDYLGNTKDWYIEEVNDLLTYPGYADKLDKILKTSYEGEDVIHRTNKKQENKNMVEKIVLKESMQNLPDWFTKNVDKDVLAKINNQGIDLHNCKFTEMSKKTNRASEWNNGDVIIFFFDYDDSWSNGKHHEDVVAYIPNYDRIFGPYKYHDWSRKQLLDKASKVAVISKADDSNLKSDKDAYEDPRHWGYKYRDYAGQKKDIDYWGDDAEWETPSGRDKSGYEIPTPEYWQIRLFNYNFKDTYNKYKVSLDDLYNRIESAKDRLFDSVQNKYDISNYNDINSSAISNAFSCLGSACRYYNYVLEKLDKLKEYRDKSMNSSNEYDIEKFNSYYKWAVDYLESLEKEIDKI